MTSIRNVPDKLKSRRRLAGFSLIELLVVVTLIAILAASVTVSIRGAQDGHALRTAADDLAGAIRFGFEESRLKSIAHHVAFTDNGASFRLEAATGDVAQPYRPVPGMAGVYRRLPSGVQIAAVEPTGAASMESVCTDISCASPGGFDGMITLKNRQGETIKLEVLGGTGQVYVGP